MTQVQQNNIQDLDDLAAQVEELVSELSEACQQVSKRLSDDEPEEDAAEPEDRAETPAEEAEAPDPSEAEADETAEAAAGPDAPEPHPAEQAIDELEQQLEDLIDAGAEQDAEAEAAAPTPKARAEKPEAAAAPAAEDLEDLDQQIAALTDELLDGDFVDADGEAVGTSAAPAADERAPEPEAEPQPATPAAKAKPSGPALDDESAEPEDTVQAPAEQTEDDGAEAPATAPASPATQREVARPAASKPAGRSSDGPHPVVAVMLATAKKAEAGARTLADLASTPLKNRPKIVRDTVGWFGLWTLFLAICVWVTLAFFRSPDHPQAEGDPMRIRTADESSSPPPPNQRPLPHPEAVRSVSPR
ncbi:MAG: hypothetical protein JJU33_06260 [Phycisphaerales bacterium]|nr:hypothetical protein [Phycisphaerales bacterium]